MRNHQVQFSWTADMAAPGWSAPLNPLTPEKKERSGLQSVQPEPGDIAAGLTKIKSG
jgi:hypothetical protein